MQIELSSSYSDDEIKRAAEIREWLVKLIADKHEEIEKLRVTLSLVDSMLKLGSFKAASSLKDTYTLQSNPTNQSTPSEAHVNSSQAGSRQSIASNIVEHDNEATATDVLHNGSESAGTASDPSRTTAMEFKELRRVRDNLLLAKAEVTTNFVNIVPSENILLSTNTPPFRSFFLGRILDGMKAKDEEKARNMQIRATESLAYVVEENENNVISKIRINNYRERERLNEIFNTCTWVFSRMIEKSSR
jgi:light-regulated signal transduction histidine kinase (bacteriophytochrome)